MMLGDFRWSNHKKTNEFECVWVFFLQCVFLIFRNSLSLNEARIKRTDRIFTENHFDMKWKKRTKYIHVIITKQFNFLIHVVDMQHEAITATKCSVQMFFV